MRPTCILATAVAFTGGRRMEHEFIVTDDCIQVWDPIADAYTINHALSEADEKRIRELARKHDEIWKK